MVIGRYTCIQMIGQEVDIRAKMKIIYSKRQTLTFIRKHSHWPFSPPLSLYIYIYICVYIYIYIGNGRGDTSSNPGRD